MNRIQKILLIAIFAIGFLARLYKINNPVADWHSWRQADTASVTRYFVTNGVNMFLPRYHSFFEVNDRSLVNPSGFRMVEFPVFNLVHTAFVKLFPFKTLEYWGRMTAVLSSMVSGLLIFILVKRHGNVSVALLSTFIFFVLPYNIFFSRVILPEPLMVALWLATLNFFDLWIKKSSWITFILTAICGCLAFLVKPVAVFFFLPMLWQARHKLNDARLYWMAAFMIVPTLLWRQWGAKFPEGIPQYLWLLNGNGIRFKGAFFRWIFSERLGSMILGNWGLLPLATGIVAISGVGYFMTWIAGALIYLFTFATGNVHHDYYQIPIIPIVSIVAAYGIVYLWKAENTFMATYVKRGVTVVALIFALAFSWYQIKGNYQVNHWEIVYAGQAVQRLVPENAIIAAPYNGDTSFLYQTNRRGFGHLLLPIEELRDKYGVTYFVSVNYDDDTNRIMREHTVIESTPGYVVVKINPAPVVQ